MINFDYNFNFQFLLITLCRIKTLNDFDFGFSKYFDWFKEMLTLNNNNNNSFYFTKWVSAVQMEVIYKDLIIQLERRSNFALCLSLFFVDYSFLFVSIRGKKKSCGGGSRSRDGELTFNCWRQVVRLAPSTYNDIALYLMWLAKARWCPTSIYMYVC